MTCTIPPRSLPFAPISALTLVLACGDATQTSDGATFPGVTTVTPTTPGPTTTEQIPTTTGPDTNTSGSDANSEADSQVDTTGMLASTTDATASSSSSESDDTVANTTSASDASTTSEPDQNTVPCQVVNTKVTPVPPDIMFVLDKSGSMSMEQWDHDDDGQTPPVTRWFSLHGVVTAILTKFNNNANFGVKLYPKRTAKSFLNQGACDVDPGVEVEIAPKNKDNVLMGIPEANAAVLGGTPLMTGLHVAFEYLHAVGPEHQRFALLVADGEISEACPGEQYLQAVATVKDGYDAGIPTYVVGIDVNPETTFQLSGLAAAGGTAPFYQTKNQIELQAAIQGIIDATLSCVVAIDPAPNEPDLFQVWIGNNKIPQVDDCSQDGWVWTVPHTEIELCGSACTNLKSSGQVEARYFCTAG